MYLHAPAQHTAHKTYCRKLHAFARDDARVMSDDVMSVSTGLELGCARDCVLVDEEQQGAIQQQLGSWADGLWNKQACHATAATACQGIHEAVSAAHRLAEWVMRELKIPSKVDSSRGPKPNRPASQEQQLPHNQPVAASQMGTEIAASNVQSSTPPVGHLWHCTVCAAQLLESAICVWYAAQHMNVADRNTRKQHNEAGFAIQTAWLTPLCSWI
jgi:hypothetical protein